MHSVCAFIISRPEKEVFIALFFCQTQNIGCQTPDIGVKTPDIACQTSGIACQTPGIARQTPVIGVKAQDIARQTPGMDCKTRDMGGKTMNMGGKTAIKAEKLLTAATLFTLPAVFCLVFSFMSPAEVFHSIIVASHMWGLQSVVGIRD